MHLEKIVHNIRVFYSSCIEYRDRSCSQVQLVGVDCNLLTSVESETHFYRSKSFDMKFRVSSPAFGEYQSRITSDLSTAKVHDDDSILDYNSLVSALKIKAGVSFRVSTLIPLLLIGTEHVPWLQELTRYDVRPNGEFVIRSDSGADEIHVDPQEFSIRKLRFKRSIKGDSDMMKLFKNFTHQTDRIRPALDKIAEHDYFLEIPVMA